MDCSTISNCTRFENETNENITQGDLQEKYFSLKQQLESITKCYESTKQELHETKRCYQTALDIQEHLTSEVEAFQVNESKQKTEFNLKLQSLQEEIQTLRDDRSKTTEYHFKIVEELQEKITQLEERTHFKNESLDVVEQSKNQTGFNEECVELKNENFTLHEALEQQKKAVSECNAIIATLKEQLNELNDEMSCAKSNLCTKREELESTTELLHATQSELAVANMELQRLKNEGNAHAAKGNSLFAEVEDKRQEMAKNLIQMKQSNVQLKRELSNKQAEINTLLCERSQWEEYLGMTTHHDSELIKSYEQRITDLESLVEQQRRDITKWFSKYYEPGTTQADEWIGGVLSHFKNRCGTLTSELTAVSIDNLNKAVQIRDLHKQLASWKLKATNGIVTENKHEDVDRKPLKSIENGSGELKRFDSKAVTVKKKVTF